MNVHLYNYQEGEYLDVCLNFLDERTIRTIRNFEMLF
jgi:hypothetical protein